MKKILFALTLATYQISFFAVDAHTESYADPRIKKGRAYIPSDSHTNKHIALTEKEKIYESPDAHQYSRSITVIGKGKVYASPDLAVLALSVQSEEKTPEEAFAKNSEIINRVINTIKAYGVDDRDLQTSNISIYPQYNYITDPDGKQINQLSGYHIVNSLSVRVRNLSKLNIIMEKAFEAGINQGGNVSFFNEDLSKILTDARKKAVEDAMVKAKILTESSNVKLGSIINIVEEESENSSNSVLQASQNTENGAESTPIQTGENSYEAVIRIQFQIN